MFSQKSQQLLRINYRINKFYKLLSISSQRISTNASKRDRKQGFIDKFVDLRNKLPSKISLEVIGNCSEANPSSLLLKSDEKLYLFNCGEGLQRLLPEYKSFIFIYFYFY
jgi:hypothetical protein